jgi:hypothetical protein
MKGTARVVHTYSLFVPSGEAVPSVYLTMQMTSRKEDVLGLLGRSMLAPLLHERQRAIADSLKGSVRLMEAN